MRRHDRTDLTAPPIAPLRPSTRLVHAAYARVTAPQSTTIRWRRLWLCVPVAFMVAVDGGCTLLGQSPIYWAGRYDYVIEGFWLFRAALRTHPAAFLIVRR